MKAVSLEDMQDSQFLTAAIYGCGGVGKTTLAATFPGPILYFDFDGKLGTLTKEARKNCFALSYRYSNPTQASEIFLDFRADWMKVKRGGYKLPNGESPQTVVLDSVTLFDIIAINHFVKEGGGNPEEDKPNLKHYGDQASYYNSFFAGINGFKCNLIMIFHEFYKTDEHGMVEGIQPLITGSKMLNKIPAMFQELWWYQLQGDKRILNYKPARGATANSISLEGSGKIMEPTYEKIVKERKK